MELCFSCTSKTARRTHTEVLISVKDWFVLCFGLVFVLQAGGELQLSVGKRSGGSDGIPVVHFSVGISLEQRHVLSIPLSTFWFVPDGRALQIEEVVPQNTDFHHSES